MLNKTILQVSLDSTTAIPETPKFSWCPLVTLETWKHKLWPHLFIYLHSCGALESVNQGAVIKERCGIAECL